MVEFEVDLDWGRLTWIGFGIVLGLVVVWVIHSFVGTFVFGLFIYYSTRRVNRHVRGVVGQRTLAAVLSLTLLALPALLLLYYTVAISLQEFARFSERADLQPYLQITGDYLNVSSIVENPESLLTEDGGVELIQSTLTQAADYLGFIGTGLLHTFVMFAVAFYLLRDGPRLSRWAGTFGDEHGILEAYGRAVDGSLERIFAGNILNAVVTGMIGAITYSLLNLAAPPALSIPYPALVGLLAGVASLIPVVGMKLVYVPVAGYLSMLAYLQGSGWGFVALFVAVSFVVVDAIPDFLVRPYVSGGGLHVGTVMFAYILGPLLFGWYGIFLAPVILVLVTHFVRLVLPELFTGKPIRPAAIDPANAVEPAPAPRGPLDSVATDGSETTDDPDGGLTDESTTDGRPESG